MGNLAPTVLGAIVACGLALLIGGYVLFSPGPVRLPLERRRPGSGRAPSPLARTTSTATGVIDTVLRRSGRTGGVAVLERAGVKTSLQEVTLLIIGGSLAAIAVGVLLRGVLLGLLLGVAVPIVVRVYLGVLASRRHKAFADQLEDSLQLMASSLRAGHSLLQALASVAREAEQPTSEEFSRVINETRVGRELGGALDETAHRMGSEDFLWVTQAVAINREVGGNLAEVLDRVGHTIRERNQIRRQVKALSAEGKLSAIVLMALPFGILAFLSLTNPAYIATFTESLIGYLLIAAGVLLLVIGGLWLRKVVSFRF
ncbi:MAG: type II secretion system F family protein [Actinomycetes bacterium]